MRNVSVTGRIFYGIAITVLGAVTIYYRDFPYMLIPPKHSSIPGLIIIAYISGALLILAGVCIIFAKKITTISLLSGTVLLLIFCFYYVPYQFMSAARYTHFGNWENAAKELALCGGAFVIAGCFKEKKENWLTGFLSKLIPVGFILFPVTIISFGINHFLFAREAADYVPSWVPWHLFWIYFCGVALLGSGLAILLKIKPALVAALLGLMILTWFIVLHIPGIIASPAAYMGSEITSAFIALAYSGIAFVIAGSAKRQQSQQIHV